MSKLPTEIKDTIEQLNKIAEQCDADLAILRKSFKAYHEAFNRLRVILSDLDPEKSDRIKPGDLPF